jgi:hypothetical protein
LPVITTQPLASIPQVVLLMPLLQKVPVPEQPAGGGGQVQEAFG